MSRSAHLATLFDVMENYRISRWSDTRALSDGGLNKRRAVMAMSVRWVSRRWLESEAQLSARQVDQLLDSLREAGVLEVGQGSIIDDVDLPDREPVWREVLQFLRWRWRVLRGDASGSRQRWPVLDGMAPFDVQLLVEELDVVLGLTLSARRALPDLSRLERALRTGGPAAVDALPTRVLQGALAQLRWLGPMASTGGLLTLRLRLEMAIESATWDMESKQRRLQALHKTAPSSVGRAPFRFFISKLVR